jgi:hypothetical protein
VALVCGYHPHVVAPRRLLGLAPKSIVRQKRKAQTCEFKYAQTGLVVEPQTTNLGVRSSNLFGRASFRQFPCESHGIHTASDPGNREHVGPISCRSDCESGVRNSNLFGRSSAAVFRVIHTAFARQFKFPEAKSYCRIRPFIVNKWSMRINSGF